ncbi:EI24 domain-containing protein [Novosphingobium lentum]|uniref:EI24 domain-containing protein n=1 Tax=Novosphingobium lentum TaxID=145287 RepID=UPI00082E599A|nr:EI24 domain-containing protein [Novosphingobium lentum]
MLTAFALAIGQLADRRILAVLAKSLAITVVLVAALGWGAWQGIDSLVAGLDDWLPDGLGGLRQLIDAVAAIIAAWLLFQIVAFAVMQFFADDVVDAVEARHYPATAALAQRIGVIGNVRIGLGGAARAVVYNLAAVPFAIALLFTAIGPALAFGLANALLIGRELNDMVRFRYRDAAGQPPALLHSLTRLGLGGIVVLLLLVPFVNLLSPVIGAAMATHLVHRRKPGVPDAG